MSEVRSEVSATAAGAPASAEVCSAAATVATDATEDFSVTRTRC